MLQQRSTMSLTSTTTSTLVTSSPMDEPQPPGSAVGANATGSAASVACFNESQKSSISSSSSMLTNSSASPSSSLTSIPTSSPTSANFTSNSQSMRSVSISLTSTETMLTALIASAASQTKAQSKAQLADEESLASGMLPPKVFNHTITALTGADSTEPKAAQSNDAIDELPGGEGAPERVTFVPFMPQEEQSGLLEETELGGQMVGDAQAMRHDSRDVYLADSGLEIANTNIDGTHPRENSEELQASFASASVAPENAARLERSNSCSQAGEPLSTAPIGAAIIGLTSVSHENLTSSSSASTGLATIVSPSSLDPANSTGHLCQASATGSDALSGSAGAFSASGNQKWQQEAIEPISIKSASVQKQQPPQQQTTSSRFFSSKLNTGSLWSLLSVGSTNSGGANDMAVHETVSDMSTMGNASSNSFENEPRDQQESSKASTGFFSRVQFKRTLSSSQQQQQQSSVSQEPKSIATGHTIRDNNQQAAQLNQQQANSSLVSQTKQHRHQQQAAERKRFNVKYIGSAILHKNFTLPMLEWIAKDIKRQTIKGAQSTSQRQFTIPVRDIVLEIQFYQLTAISCKDGHCIFVHPMHCVSKYAQLQHDPTCFSYLIRDNKESPYFCHVFQAKSANKVHDIFSAIREATTRTQITATAAAALGPSAAINSTALGDPSGQSFHASAYLNAPPQRSATTDGAQQSAFKSLLNPTQGDSAAARLQAPGPATQPASSQPSKGQSLLSSSVPNNSVIQSVGPRHGSSQPIVARATTAATVGARGAPQAATGAASSTNFENSYQFEVMFVKKVKLQCRRVPASFVDDALETLKSFEVLKGGESKAQIKGLGKRIISACVDERQEYDEACQSPTPESSHQKSTLSARVNKPPADDNERLQVSNETSRERRSPESRSCQQSPTNKQQLGDHETGERRDSMPQDGETSKKNHQSMGCLKSIDCSIKSAKDGSAPNYTNDFSPYNTITSTDLNERIAAIPVVSSSVSLDHETRQKLARQVRETIMATAANIKKGLYDSGDKLDSSTSSKALDSLSCTVTSSVPSVDDRFSPIFMDEPVSGSGGQQQLHGGTFVAANDRCQASSQARWGARPGVSTDTGTSFDKASTTTNETHRRASVTPASSSFQQNTHQQSTNNFDLFRRASARQVVKNRTMLLLIGKDELCTISIDKHQMLFSKSFNSIVHCLQGNNNKDHFGLICRDSGKINPNTESYAGFIFKCQSDKVVREIMGALKQVIYSSQHNYHGLNSPYNPLNALVANHYNLHPQASLAVAKQQVVEQQHRSAKPVMVAQQSKQEQMKSNLLLGLAESDLEKQAATQTANSLSHQNIQAPRSPSLSSSPSAAGGDQSGQLSLAAKRGLTLNQLSGVDEAANHNRQSLYGGSSSRPDQPRAPTTAPPAPMGDLSSPFIPNPSASSLNFSHSSLATPLAAPSQPLKNIIKSMFCDNCPLYWYHRLCCDIESLPAEASKAIILRRIDTSLPEKEQDELYSRFSEFNIESIDEHNEIFMSLLRHLCERKQLKHNQGHSHQSAMAKSSALVKQQEASAAAAAAAASTTLVSKPTQLASASWNSFKATPVQGGNTHANSHQRSVSTSGSLSSVLGQTGNSISTNQAIADAGSAAMDNLKRAKNSISVSIENILKRRSSMRDDQPGAQVDNEDRERLEIMAATRSSHLPTRSGSFRSASRETRANEAAEQRDGAGGFLKRSQSTSDYPGCGSASQQPGSFWRDSFGRTLNDDLANPFAGFFSRRGSNSNSRQVLPAIVGEQPSGEQSTGNAARLLAPQGIGTLQTSSCNSPDGQPASPKVSESRFAYGSVQNGGASPSSMLSSAFWKKSIFDKIRQPPTRSPGAETNTTPNEACSPVAQAPSGSRISPSSDGPNIPSSNESQASSLQATETKPIKRSGEELRSLWRKAILEQITLLKMDKQNQRLLANAAECDIQRVKLNYRDVVYGRDVMALWDKLLKQDPTKKVNFVEVARLVRLGVPKLRRGETWMFLMNQYQLRHGTSFQPTDDEFKGDANQTYRSLLSQLSVQQHEIFVDIGRTFPTHPYYSQYLSIGQLSLFNLLKAYSLLDQEVGYCQGLSFVAGILLLHVNTEDEAFELMRHLLFNFGLRTQYLPSMNALHLQLYQITRLLRDHEYDLFNHFDHHDISPSLYAAPWFLTLFASQFPLGFVARLLDLIFLIGIEAIFRVSLNLLAYHRTSILNCNSLESTMQFMKTDLVNIDDKNLVKIFDKSFCLDLRNKLIEYEIEYTFYCAEARSSGGHHNLGQSNQCKSDSAYDDQSKSTDQQTSVESTSVVADATATVIIQHLLANNHLKSLRTNYSY